jgi:hypothetical protein
MKHIFIILSVFFVGLYSLHGQATLVIQGSVQNSSGAPVSNGTYSMTFRLYETESGGTPIWSETQPAVAVTGGLYNISLGSVSPLTAPFSTVYYLGISIGTGAELIPRARLTSSPYAMSLLGETNLFPSGGAVGAGTVNPQSGTQLHVKNTDGTGRLIVEGDNDAVIRLKQGSNSSDITFDGNKITIANMSLILSDDLNLPAGASIKYNGLPGWRLIDRDDFEAGDDGWSCVDDWTNNTTRTFQRFTPNTPFSQGYILRPDQNGNDVLKKKFDLTGIPHSRVRVVFTFHFFDTWSFKEAGWAGFASQLNPYTAPAQSNGYFQTGWVGEHPGEFDFGGVGYVNYFATIGGVNNNIADGNLRGEMIAQHTGNDFWLLFGSTLDQGAPDESYGISNIEIWVQ